MRNQEKIKELEERFAKFAKARRKPIKQNNIEKVFKIKPEKEGKVWVVKYKGREFRNPDKKNCIKDVATVFGYDVEK